MFSCCDCRKDDRAGFRRPVSAQPEQAGVGIIFKPSFNNESFMALIVHDLVKGSSADRLGGIHRGDMLQSIDGIDVFKRPAQEVSALLLGLPGTIVHLGVFRELTPEEKQRTDPKPYPQHLSTSQSVFQLHLVELTRIIPIDRTVGAHFVAGHGVERSSPQGKGTSH